jgi:dihydrofolate reductase/thymidylate synthase
MYFNLIVAYDSKNGIGLNGTIPWKLPEDLKNFKDITTKVPTDDFYEYINMVVMGRKTWDSLPEKFKPLPGRLNVIISNQLAENISHHDHEMVRVISDFDQIYDYNTLNFKKNDEKESKEFAAKSHDDSLKKTKKIHQVFVIGGESIYKMAINSPYCRMIYATEIYKDFGCDTHFPKIPLNLYKNKNELEKDLNNKFEIQLKDESENPEGIIANNFKISTLSEIKEFKNQETNESIYYRFITYYHPLRVFNVLQWKNKEEEKYLETMQDILLNGIYRIDRTLVGSYFLPGVCLKFNIKNQFPISTTKKIVLRWIFEELRLYITGKTDTKILSNQGITIWDGNTSREFLDKRGLSHLPEGDMGETYGFNFRHYGGEYKDCHTEYDSTVGYDQLANVIHLLKTDPTSRRIIINLWNPATQDKAALPSCLFYYQFCVDPEKKELHCIIHLRSSDYFLANNWNTCTGTMLTYMLCNLEGIDLTPGTITVMVSDAHIYKTHIQQVCQNLLRESYPYPILKVKEKKKKIDDFTFKDFELIGYKSHGSLKAEMAI